MGTIYIYIRTVRSYPHCLYWFLDGKKTSHFWFILPGVRGTHTIIKQKQLFNSREFFFRKSTFCTFSWINPGFGGPWDMLWISFGYGTFIMLQKKSFGQNNFWISYTGSKVPLWQFFNFAKMALLNPCMKFKNFFGQKYSFDALWKWQ